MSDLSIHKPVIGQTGPDMGGWLKAALLCWGFMLLLGIAWLVANLDAAGRGGRTFLLPWALAAGIVIAAPPIWLVYKRNFDPFHPIVFAAWTFFLPGFFLGSLFLASGVSEPDFLLFVGDERYSLPLALLYAMMGYACLAAGFFLPVGRFVGHVVGRRLPDIHIPTHRIPVAGSVLLLVGVLVVLTSFLQGRFGFQKLEDVPVYSGVMFLVGQYWIQASFLLWLYAFRDGSGSRKYAVMALAIAAAILHATFAGNRGSLLQSTFLVGFAYVLAGTRLTAKHYAVGTFLVLTAVLVGMMYGTAFRRQKGTREGVTATEYTTIIGQTVENITEQDPVAVIDQSLQDIAIRLDATPSLAVVVSKYNVLAADEERWGISNNILTDSVLFFVPRLVWPNKPVGIPPEAYAELYFNYRENSFTMTPMGDLLRNFGPVGVPLGMLFLGIVLRMIYGALVDAPSFSYARTSMYFMLITTVSYEGTFGLIIPNLIKVGAATLGGIVLVWLVARILPEGDRTFAARVREG